MGDRVIAEADRLSSTSVVSVGPDGSVRKVRGLDYAFSFDPVHQWVIGKTVAGDSVVLDPVTGKVQWRSPWDSWTLNSVSPDGRVVLGIDNSKYALLDATDGHLIARIQPEGPPSLHSVAPEVRGMSWDHDALLSNGVATDGNAILRSDSSRHPGGHQGRVLERRADGQDPVVLRPDVALRSPFGRCNPLRAVRVAVVRPDEDGDDTDAAVDRKGARPDGRAHVVAKPGLRVLAGGA